jgi:hypothetical protein
VTDSRFIGYQRDYGAESWELDALEPAVLDALVTEHIKSEIDEDLWKEREDEIDDIKGRLLTTADEFDT